ncbi:zinc finger protein 585B-like, partial [Sitodiplosis mosellana]|uniref:zinc finger protein 585B-like n=1 Tax=Sitodiplosis mosellana TaxID=263140 RepID=UPI0024452E8C
EMKPFKVVSGRCRRRKSKSAKVEVKQELVIKEEPNDGDDVMNIPRPTVDGRYRVKYEGPIDFARDFDQIKDEIKCEEEETSKEKDSTPCERSNDNDANYDDNEDPMDDAIDVQQPESVGSGKKRNEGAKRRNKRTIPGNQATKKQKKHKCHVCNHLIYLNQHLSSTHSDQFLFQCSKCFGGYATEGVKDLHEDSCGHRQYQCHLCKEYGRDKQDLKIHMRKDTPESGFDAKFVRQALPRKEMNPFKGVSGRRCKRKPKSEMIEVKQEPGIKEEPRDDGVMNIPQPRIDGRYRVNYEGSVDFGDDFDQIKDEIKCENKEAGKEKDSTPCERLNDGAANADDNELSMGDAIDIQPPHPVDNEKTRNGSSKRRDKRSISRNQVAKKQKKHKCHVCNYLANDNYALKLHLRIHTGEKPYQCDVCSKSFARKSHLNRHKKTHGPKPQFRCSKCNQGFDQESDKIDHERFCSPQQFECDTCGYRTINKSDLTKHMRNTPGKSRSSAQSVSSRIQATLIFKNIQWRTKKNSRMLVRNVVDDSPLQTISNHTKRAANEVHLHIHLNQHLSSAHGDQFPFQCSKCFGGYAGEDAKEAHEDSCGYRQYQCHLCKEHRSNKQCSNIHMRKDHTGERIRCKVCAASFA